MFIIKDEERLLNIHPLIVYFVLTEEEILLYGEELKKLNRDTKFTRGIFKFRIVPKQRKYKDPSPTNPVYMLRNYNVVIRLMDKDSDNYYYTAQQYRLSEGLKEVYKYLPGLITAVCDQNAWHLKERISVCFDDDKRKQLEQLRKVFTFAKKTDCSPQKQKAAECQTPPFREYRSNACKVPVTEDTQSGKGRIKGITANIKPSGKTERKNPFQEDSEKLQEQAIKELIAMGMGQSTARKATSVVWKMVEQMLATSSLRVSDQLAHDFMDGNNSTAFMLEQYLRKRPYPEPTVSAELKEVVARRMKNGKEKKAWGVVMTVNGKEHPIYFGGKDKTMLYVCTLLRLKIGERMYIHEFFNNSKGRRSRFSRQKTRSWLEAVYNQLFPSQDRSFDQWIEKIEQTNGRPLNQGKSQVAKQIAVTLADCPDGIYYFIPRTSEDFESDTYYEVMLTPEQLTVDPQLQPLLNLFYTTTGIHTDKDIRE